jgi:hypothetical protein
MLVFAGLSLLVTVVLMTGRTGTPGLYAGRLLTGTVFTVGTAWVNDDSHVLPALAREDADRMGPRWS